MTIEEAYKELNALDVIGALEKIKKNNKQLYTRFSIKKNNGKLRWIEAPCDDLKCLQTKHKELLEWIIHVSPFAHGFCKNRNILTMAEGHVKKPWVLSVDFSDFFPSVKAKRYMKVWNKKKKQDGLLSYRATRKLDSDIYNLHFYNFQDGKGDRLPQGAPASPLLSNAYLHKFDWDMAHIARNKGVTFSRYADDYVLSGEDKNVLWRLYYKAKDAIENKWFLRINKAKTKMKSNKQRQMVCGIVVNEKINLPRKWRKNFRAELFQQKNNKGLRLDSKGRLSFKYMVETFNKQRENFLIGNGLDLNDNWLPNNIDRINFLEMNKNL